MKLIFEYEEEKITGHVPDADDFDNGSGSGNGSDDRYDNGSGERSAEEDRDHPQQEDRWHLRADLGNGLPARGRNAHERARTQR